jgi:hypothetical protein
MRRFPLAVAFLIACSPAAIAQTPPQSPPPTSQPTSAPTTRPSSGVKPVAPGQLLDSLLKPPSAAGQPLQPIPEGPAVDATTGAGAVAPGAPQLNLRREGSLILDATARLTRGADGATAELTFEADGKAMKDPPMIILPNLKLTQMENAVTSSARDIRFKVTGTVTEYKGRNYILLEKVVVVPEVTQQF